MLFRSVSKILLPETQSSETSADKKISMKADTNNILDAISRGTSDGLNLALNIAAMLIAFISLVALINGILSAISSYIFDFEITLNYIFAKLFYYVAYFLGVSKEDLPNAGALLGQKIVLNEMVAYGAMLKTALSVRSQAILTYALCG